MADDLEVAGYIVQHLSDILTQAGHRAVAGRAGTGWRVNDIFTRQMGRQRPPMRARLAAARGFGGALSPGFRLDGLQLFKGQFELLDLAVERTPRITSLMAASDMNPAP
nr:hypothetical protein [Zavarzinia compransoris]